MDASTGPRCDGTCPAAALDIWMHEDTGAIVTLCRHHSRQHQMALYDQRFRLVEAAPVPA